MVVTPMAVRLTRVLPIESLSIRIAVLQYEAQHGQAGTGQRDKNDATPPEKIGGHQHDNDVEDGNRDVQRCKSVNCKDYDSECSGNELRSRPVAECRWEGRYGSSRLCPFCMPCGQCWQYCTAIASIAMRRTLPL